MHQLLCGWGGMIIEKYFKLESKKGLDSKFSISKNSILQLVNECQESFKSVGKVKYGPSSNETPYLKFRRSIYASASIKKGEVLSQENIKVVRPYYGLHLNFLQKYWAKRLRKILNLLKELQLKKLYFKNTYIK